jgi:hypothetical protein
MIWKYLKQDIIGSRKNVYGRKGDRVHIIKHQLEMILVINERGNKFFVKSDDLTGTNDFTNQKP